MSKVLITGANSFLGSYAVARALDQGHTVSATVRATAQDATTLELIARSESSPKQLTLYRADVTKREGWREAVAGCDYLLHIASPRSEYASDDQSQLELMATRGVHHVLGAAAREGVRRAVLTSSVSAITYGAEDPIGPLDESSWSDPAAGPMPAAMKAKLVAEQAAWSLIENEGMGMELTVINPVGIFGPMSSLVTSASVEIIRAMLLGAWPVAPRNYLGIVDVRDLADLHLTAMQHQEAAGERFIAQADEVSYSMLDISLMLREAMGEAAALAPRTMNQDEALLRMCEESPQLTALVAQVGAAHTTTPRKAKMVLGFSPRPAHQTILETAESLLELGLYSA